jgi:hypothetical protein
MNFNLTPSIPEEVKSVSDIDQNQLLQDIFLATLSKSADKKYKLFIALYSQLETVHNIAVAMGNKEPMYDSTILYSMTHILGSNRP